MRIILKAHSHIYRNTGVFSTKTNKTQDETKTKTDKTQDDIIIKTDNTHLLYAFCWNYTIHYITLVRFAGCIFISKFYKKGGKPNEKTKTQPAVIWESINTD